MLCGVLPDHSRQCGGERALATLHTTHSTLTLSPGAQMKERIVQLLSQKDSSLDAVKEHVQGAVGARRLHG